MADGPESKGQSLMQKKERKEMRGEERGEKGRGGEERERNRKGKANKVQQRLDGNSLNLVIETERYKSQNKTR